MAVLEEVFGMGSRIASALEQARLVSIRQLAQELLNMFNVGGWC